METSEEQIAKFIEFISHIKKDINQNKEMVKVLECSENILDVFYQLEELLVFLEGKINNKELKINYVNQLESNLESIRNHFNYQATFDIEKHIQLMNSEDINWKKKDKQSLEDNSKKIQVAVDRLAFNLDFFKKINFFNKNVVAIGANGSGKTTLSDKFKTYLQSNGVVISAQRILLIPYFETISNALTTANALKEAQLRDKSHKKDTKFEHLQEEFSVVLRNLLAENILAGNSYRKKSMEIAEQGKPIKKPEKTKLDKTFQIWNSLIDHRAIDCVDGMNIIATWDNGGPYTANKMSDGEKGMLYLIGQVLQAPRNGFIVVDEPEMYLHKTILKKLWDILELERQDCLFIYLTHDLDFATSRTTAKKVWIKSFTYPDKWEIEEIPENEIPESLLFELLGSRKNILFCEGEKGKMDEKIYSILLPEFTIMPVRSCFNVIHYTKAFNLLPNVTTKAFGIIDSDHHEKDRLESLKKHNIFSISVSEVENLLLNEEFLKILGKQLLIEDSAIEKIKMETIAELDRLKEIQASNYVSTKINYYFKDSHVTEGNDLGQVEANYRTFTDKITIKDWYEKRLNVLQTFIDNKDYHSVISVFNIKNGLNPILARNFKLSDFTDRAIKLLQNNSKSHVTIMKFLPDEIKKAGSNESSS